MMHMLSLLRKELDVICTLAEGNQPEDDVVREVWLSQPSLDLAVYQLSCILEEAGM